MLAPSVGLLLLLAGADVPADGTAMSTRSSADAERLDAFVTDQMQRADVPGVAYAVVGPDGAEHRGTFGEDGDGEPVTARTPFLWGSVAKPVTASLVVRMAGAGELDLDEPVATYLPDFEMADGAAQQITVRHLLSHTSGIPERMDFTDRDDPDRRPGDVVDDLEDTELASAPGEEHLYASINYMLLGAVVEEVSGRPFAEMLRERVLDPAGMSTAITDGEEASRRLPPGHRYVLGRARPFRTPFDPAGLSSGYLAGSLEDAVEFARANLSGSDVLTPAERAMLVRPQVTTGTDRSYGLGWRTWPVFGADAPMVWHAGAAPGFQAAIVLLPEQDRAVVVLQNVYGSFQESQLLDTAWGLASLLSGAEPELHGPDRLYWVVLTVLGAVCLGLLAALVGTARRLVRRTAAGSRRRALAGLGAWLGGLTATAALLLGLPAYFGVALGQVVLWAPDVAALLVAGLVLVVVVGVGRVAVTAWSWREPASSPDPDGLPLRRRTASR